MKELTGDLWDFHARGCFICITTNNTIKKNGECVMGRGIAAQAKKRFAQLPFLLGDKIQRVGNGVHVFGALHLIMFPVKWNWNERADLALIQVSAQQLVDYCDQCKVNEVYLPRPGCGNGGLRWSVVKPFLEPILDDRFTIVEMRP